MNGIFGCRFFSRTISQDLPPPYSVTVAPHFVQGTLHRVVKGRYDGPLYLFTTSQKRIVAMKIISRLIAVILFVGFFFFALRNTQEVTLHFFLGYERTDPLVLVLLAFFVVGAILGVLAMTPIMFRHRREATRLKKALAQIHKQQEEIAQAQVQPPLPDSVITAQHIL
jgi:uncharacterized integral membrane protein